MDRQLKRPARHHQEERSTGSVSDKMTPECYLCGAAFVGIAEEAVVMLRGQWFHSIEYDTPVFLLDPDTRLTVLKMPNDQLALVPDQLGHPSKHAHLECLQQLAEEDEELEEDDEDDW